MRGQSLPEFRENNVMPFCLARDQVLWPRTFVLDKSVIQDIDKRVPPRQRESSRHQVLDVSPTLAVLSLSQVAPPAQVLCVI